MHYAENVVALDNLSLIHIYLLFSPEDLLKAVTIFIWIFVVKYTLDPAGSDKFSRTARPTGEDGLVLLHDVDVVGALMPRLCVTDVFEVVHHIFLTIEVIGPVSLPKQTLPRISDHRRGIPAAS